MQQLTWPRAQINWLQWFSIYSVCLSNLSCVCSIFFCDYVPPIQSLWKRDPNIHYLYNPRCTFSQVVLIINRKLIEIMIFVAWSSFQQTFASKLTNKWHCIRINRRNELPLNRFVWHGGGLPFIWLSNFKDRKL